MKRIIFKAIVPVAVVLATVMPVIGVQADNGTASNKNICDIPDMETIKRDVTDPGSRYWYPRLMERYERNETVMNLDDYRHLYLGAVFQEDYDPYRRSPLDNMLDELYYREKHTRAELDSIIAYAERALLDDPFDLNQINFLIYALRNRGKNNRANIWQYRLNHLLEAILSTGNGADPEHAWVVIDPKHEYNILNFQNAVVDSVSLTQPWYDRIVVKRPEGLAADKPTPEYFFNIRYILEEYYRKHPDEIKG